MQIIVVGVSKEFNITQMQASMYLTGMMDTHAMMCSGR
jgi:hypothetical protein